MRAVGKSRQEACRREDKEADTTGRRWGGVGSQGGRRMLWREKWGVRAHQTQEMKGKEGSGDLEGREAKSGLASSGRGLDTSGEKGFFADAKVMPPASPHHGKNQTR